jgi:hypothetical protein
LQISEDRGSTWRSCHVTWCPFDLLVHIKGLIFLWHHAESSTRWFSMGCTLLSYWSWHVVAGLFVQVKLPCPANYDLAIGSIHSPAVTNICQKYRSSSAYKMRKRVWTKSKGSFCGNECV